MTWLERIQLGLLFTMIMIFFFPWNKLQEKIDGYPKHNRNNVISNTVVDLEIN